MKKSPDAKPVTAAGGVVIRSVNGKPEVLLIKRWDVWDLPKGKLEENETIEMCAVREVAEETGSLIPLIVKRLPDTYHEYFENNVLMGKTTHWFLMIFSSIAIHFSPQEKEKIVKAEWVSLEKAAHQVAFDNLVRILLEVKKWWYKG